MEQDREQNAQGAVAGSAALAGDERLQRHQQALVEALALAQSIDYAAQPAIPPEAMPRSQPERPRSKGRLGEVRRYRLTPDETVRMRRLKQQVAELGLKARRNDLVRAGLLLLGALNEVELKAVMQRIDSVRPRKNPRQR